MKKLITLLLAALVLLTAAGCGKKNDLTGTWEYKEDSIGMTSIYDLKKDGTGTYTLQIGEQEVVYELKYEVKDGHLLVRFVNNDVFSEDDVFDSEFELKDSKTLIIKDTSGTEMTFNKK